MKKHGTRKLSPMSMRERMLAVVQGREHDRVPFVQYSGLAAPNETIWAIVGRNNMGILHGARVHRFEHPNCRFASEEFELEGRKGLRTRLYTPAGTLTREQLREPTYGTYATHKHFVTTPKEYHILIAYLKDLVVCEDMQRLAEAHRATGEDGLPHVWLERTPYQQLWIQWVSLSDLCLHMQDYPDLVQECIRLMGEKLRKVFEIVRKAPVPYVVFGDNITAPAIGEKYFREYCVPYYNELADMLAERKIPVYVHMDGDLKPLWEAIGESGVRGLDSLSPPPDNDTSVADAARLWPRMRIGVNFPSSVHLMTPAQIRQHAEEILRQAGDTGRLQIQISENVPPEIWRKSFPPIIEAIESFGPPGDGG